MNATIAKTITFRQLHEVAEAARKVGEQEGTYRMRWEFLYNPMISFSLLHDPDPAGEPMFMHGVMVAHPVQTGKRTKWYYEFEGTLF